MTSNWAYLCFYPSSQPGPWPNHWNKSWVGSCELWTRGSSSIPPYSTTTQTSSDGPRSCWRRILNAESSSRLAVTRMSKDVNNLDHACFCKPWRCMSMRGKSAVHTHYSAAAVVMTSRKWSMHDAYNVEAFQNDREGGHFICVLYGFGFYTFVTTYQHYLYRAYDKV